MFFFLSWVEWNLLPHESIYPMKPYLSIFPDIGHNNKPPLLLLSYVPCPSTTGYTDNNDDAFLFANPYSYPLFTVTQMGIIIIIMMESDADLFVLLMSIRGIIKHIWTSFIKWFISQSKAVKFILDYWSQLITKGKNIHILVLKFIISILKYFVEQGLSCRYLMTSRET